MNCSRVFFSGHAIRQMFARGIERDDVLDAIQNGTSIIDYPEDQPFPSCVLLGFVSGRPIHVVLGVDQSSGHCYVITAYIPDPALWDEELKRRRSP